MAIYINYSQAEKESFKIVPETCPAVEKAIWDAFKNPDFTDEGVSAILAKYDIEMSKNLCHALDEVVGKMLFNRRKELENVVKYEGTFPLRAALVEEVRKNKNLPNDRNRFTEWIDDHHKMQQYRNERREHV